MSGYRLDLRRLNMTSVRLRSSSVYLSPAMPAKTRGGYTSQSASISRSPIRSAPYSAGGTGVTAVGTSSGRPPSGEFSRKGVSKGNFAAMKSRRVKAFLDHAVQLDDPVQLLSATSRQRRSILARLASNPKVRRVTS
jgi:hypothetical protein